MAVFRKHRPQPPLSEGHELTLLVDGAAFFDAVESCIAAAEHYLFLETYILGSDETGWRVAGRLVEATQRGVVVSVLYDRFGSSELNPDLLEYLDQHGVLIQPFAAGSFIEKWWPLARHNHRKSVVRDGEVGIVGGMNIAAEYDAIEHGGGGWRDTAVCIRGPAVAALERSFREIWGRSGGPALPPSAPPAEPVPGGDSVRFTHNFLRKERAEIRRAYLDMIRAARRRVRICNAYFIPDRGLVKALVDAARRGVEVELIVAGKSDVPLVHMAARSFYPRLLARGVRVYEWHDCVLHAKTAVIDGELSTVGSSNLDYFSSFKNLEVNAVIASSRFGAQMDAQFEADVARSRAVTRIYLRQRSFLQSVFDRVFRYIIRGY